MLNLVRLTAYLVLSLVLMPLQWLAMTAGWRLAKTLPVHYHRWVTRLFGFSVITRGRISTTRPTLFVANHVSYIDIEILGSLLEASFIAKAEVRSWPLFGFLARLQRSVFIDRRVRSTVKQRNEVATRLGERDNLILFPEGTSGDGNRPLPFKSALFSAAEIEVDGKPVAVQPVTLAYLRIGDIPVGRTLRPLLAWYGDMSLAGHMWRVLGMSKVEILAQFHPVVTIAEFGSRKKLADHCLRVIADSLSAANAGRLPPLADEIETTESKFVPPPRAYPAAGRAATPS
jgi:1-acyl-sn-glycerol-3-phosphate acyltransferase